MSKLYEYPDSFFANRPCITLYLPERLHTHSCPVCLIEIQCLLTDSGFGVKIYLKACICLPVQRFAAAVWEAIFS